MHFSPYTRLGVIIELFGFADRSRNNFLLSQQHRLWFYQSDNFSRELKKIMGGKTDQIPSRACNNKIKHFFSGIYFPK